MSIRIKSLAQLQAAIRCVLLGLKDLHAARFAHTDIWWPNVIKCNGDAYCLIDLAIAVRLNCTWSIREHGPHHHAWTESTLTEGYTAESDLTLVGQLLTERDLPAIGESGNPFAQELPVVAYRSWMAGH